MSLRMGGVPTSHVHEIAIESLEHDIRIVPFSDVHWGSKLCHKDKFLGHLKRCADHPRVWFLGLGDYLDFSKAGDRAIMRVTAESTREAMDEVAQLRLESFYDAVGSILKGRTIGLLEGNHHWEFTDSGETCTQRLCTMLSVPYLGCLSSVVLRLGCHGSHASYPILAMHRSGAGGGHTAGAAFNGLQRLALWFRNAKAYMSGDDHRLGHIAIGGMRVDATGEWDDETIHLIKTGGWQLAYVQGQKNWLVEKAAAPMALGMPYLTLRMERRKKDGKRKLRVLSEVTV